MSVISIANTFSPNLSESDIINNKFLMIGKRSTGKTTLADKLIENMGKDNDINIVSSKSHCPDNPTVNFHYRFDEELVDYISSKCCTDKNITLILDDCLIQLIESKYKLLEILLDITNLTLIVIIQYPFHRFDSLVNKFDYLLLLSDKMMNTQIFNLVKQITFMTRYDNFNIVMDMLDTYQFLRINNIKKNEPGKSFIERKETCVIKNNPIDSQKGFIANSLLNCNFKQISESVYQTSSPVYQTSSPVYQTSSPVYQTSSPVYQTLSSMKNNLNQTKSIDQQIKPYILNNYSTLSTIIIGENQCANYYAMKTLINRYDAVKNIDNVVVLTNHAKNIYTNITESVYSNIDVLSKVCKSQMSYMNRSMKKYEKFDHTLIIIDMDSMTKLNNCEAFKNIVLNGRHYNISLIIVSSYPSHFVQNIDTVMIGKTHSDNLRNIYDEYLSFLPSYKYFKNIYDKICINDTTHLVVDQITNRRSTSDNIRYTNSYCATVRKYPRMHFNSNSKYNDRSSKTLKNAKQLNIFYNESDDDLSNSLNNNSCDNESCDNDSWDSKNTDESWDSKDTDKSWDSEDTDKSWDSEDTDESWDSEDTDESWDSEDTDKSWDSEDTDKSWNSDDESIRYGICDDCIHELHQKYNDIPNPRINKSFASFSKKKKKYLKSDLSQTTNIVRSSPFSADRAKKLHELQTKYTNQQGLIYSINVLLEKLKAETDETKKILDKFI
jgi:hypothetical protein